MVVESYNPGTDIKFGSLDQMDWLYVVSGAVLVAMEPVGPSSGVTTFKIKPCTFLSQLDIRPGMKLVPLSYDERISLQNSDEPDTSRT